METVGSATGRQPTIAGGRGAQRQSNCDPEPAAASWFDGIHVTMAGTFIALEGAWRQHSEVSNGASDPPFGSPGIPLQNSTLYNEREFRASAQQSRIALKMTGDIDSNQHLKGYYEMDFLGASTDANNRESNRYARRSANTTTTSITSTCRSGLEPHDSKPGRYAAK